MIKKKSYWLFLLVSIIYLVLIFFGDNENILDVNVHDTYYVILYHHLYVLLAIITFFFFTVYWVLDLVKFKLVNILSKLHVYGTLASMVGIFFPYSLVLPSSEFPLYDDWQYTNVCLSVCVLLFLLFQLLFIINIFVSIIKKLCNSAT